MSCKIGGLAAQVDQHIRNYVFIRSIEINSAICTLSICHPAFMDQEYNIRQQDLAKSNQQ